MISGARVLTLIDNVPMGNGHHGLAEIARKVAKIKVEELGSGEVIMFLNRAKDKLKIVGSRGVVLGYLKMPKGQRIMLEAIQYIPQTFGSSGALNYDKALEKALVQRLQRERGKIHLNPLQVVRAMERAGV
jgi:hypothetical protein